MSTTRHTDEWHRAYALIRVRMTIISPTDLIGPTCVCERLVYSGTNA